MEIIGNSVKMLKYHPTLMAFCPQIPPKWENPKLEMVKAIPRRTNSNALMIKSSKWRLIHQIMESYYLDRFLDFARNDDVGI